MRRSRSLELLPLNPEIERTLLRLRRENRRREEAEMADDNNNNLMQGTARALREYTVPTVSGSVIRRPAI